MKSEDLKKIEEFCNSIMNKQNQFKIKNLVMANVLFIGRKELSLAKGLGDLHGTNDLPYYRIHNEKFDGLTFCLVDCESIEAVGFVEDALIQGMTRETITESEVAK